METAQTPLDERDRPMPQIFCPFCGGAMIVLRSESRCCQCFFRACESCDDAREPDG